MIDRLTDSARKHLPEALEWLRQMVAVNSFTTRPAGVAELAELTAACFAPLGFAAERVPAANAAHGPHLFLRRCGAAAGAPPFVLVTHLDTVFSPEEERLHDFRWQREGGRIYGPGVVDNKGGTALIWLMLRVLAEVDPDAFERTHWLIAANAAEEVIGSDFADRTRERCPAGARAVLVFEGGPLDGQGHHLVVARKGRLEYRLTCTGRAAHAGSNHEHGINAVVELARVLPAVQALSDPGRHLTVNVASCHGGTVLNRVPHAAVTELEMRAFDPAVLAGAGAALEAMAGTTAAGAHLAVERMGATRAWLGGPPTEALFACWRRAADRVGLPVQRMLRGGLSDANYLSDLAPTLDALGPAGGNAHCSERSDDGAKLPEYVETGSFVPKAVMNLLALLELRTQEAPVR